MDLNIYVVSLKDAHDRRKHVVETFAALGIEFEFLDAVNGRDGQHPLLKKYNKDKFLRYVGREAVPGELGCYASHDLAWQNAVRLDKPVIVLEDDFLFRGDLKAYLECAMKLALQGHHFIRLEENRRKNVNKVQEFIRDFEGSRLVRYKQGNFRTTGYVVTPIAAQRLLDVSKEYCYPVDWVTRYLSLSKVKTYGIEPAAIYTIDADSSILGRTHQTEHFIYKLTANWFKKKTKFQDWLTEVFSYWKC